MEIYIGYLAALGTSGAWSISSVFFTLSGRRVGSPVVNRSRLVLAVGFVALMHLFMEGSLLPVGAAGFRWLWMGLSGIIGYVIGDGMLFQAFVEIGPRLSMLLMALNPVFATVLAWVLLGERLTALELLGIAVALSGVMLVLSGKENARPVRVAGTVEHAPPEEPRRFVIGVLLALGGAFGQAAGLLASRLGLAGGFSTLSGNMIRLIAATVVIWAIALMRGKARRTITALRDDPQALRTITGGAVAGPFLGVWLSLVAVQRAPLGIASTLMSLAPIALLPIGRAVFGEQITPRAVIGTVVALVGTAILFV